MAKPLSKPAAPELDAWEATNPPPAATRMRDLPEADLLRRAFLERGWTTTYAMEWLIKARGYRPEQVTHSRVRHFRDDVMLDAKHGKTTRS